MKNLLKAFFVCSILIFPLKIFLVAQVLETEESKPLLPGQFEIGTGVEFQTSNEGTEIAVPLSVEYGISKSISLLVEPVAFTRIQTKNIPTANGIGDLEFTLFYQILSEKKNSPAISIAGEVKLPTANNRQIGTGKTDYTPFIIISKTMGPFFTSLNLGYTFVGNPDNINANDLFNFSAGTIYTITPSSIIFAEVYGNTVAFGGSETSAEKMHGSTKKITQKDVKTLLAENTTELSGGELIGAAGFGYYLQKDLLISLGVSYDNNNAILFRPGIQWKFGGH
ncbi:hypothetical protein BH10BAC5_BH10BAC5_22020 [soil metagenome]